MSRLRTRYGFTLVELLVVIGIIALLIAFLMPALKSARAQAQAIQCRSNLKQVFMALSLYAADNNGLIRQASGHRSPLEPSKYPMWHHYFFGPGNDEGMKVGTVAYLKTWDVLICPNGPRQVSGGARHQSYALNRRMFGWSGTRPRWLIAEKAGQKDNKSDLIYYRLAASRWPSQMYLVADSNVDGAYTLKWMDTNDAGWWPRANHKRLANMLYHDGHVGTVGRPELADNTVSGKRDRLPWRNVIK